jgi:SpoVK/Ycf46/Vps4 family AAA+-type ATPase
MKIKHNADLQMIFDHVNLQFLGGGIIVFEDIDAMTTLVHNRSVNNFENENSLLTLEYFLNLLQGSLTRDGSIFIATTNHIEILDPAFYRVGRFDVKIHMKKADHFQIKNIYEKFVHRQIKPEILSQIKENTFTPAEIIFHLINYIDSDLDDLEIMSTFIKSD